MSATILKFPASTRPAELIAARIETLRRHIAHMAAVNMMLAAGDVRGVLDLGYSESQVGALLKCNSLGEVGFSSRTFEDTEAKIAQLERMKA